MERFRLTALALAVAGCPKPTLPEGPPVATGRCAPTADGSRTFALLHLNDVYRIEGHLDGAGGLSRVRTLRTQLEAECGGAVLVTHAGDAFYPSLGSGKVFEARQMIDVLNLLDGSDERDPLLLATFGNHEFDASDPDQADDFFGLVQSSDFPWLHTNITWNEHVLPMGDLEKTVSLDLHGVRIGLYSLTIDKDGPSFGTIGGDYDVVSDAMVAALRPEHDVVLALTHLDMPVDRALIRRDAAPDAVLGGHDHTFMEDTHDGRVVVKGDADARSVIVAWVTVAADQSVTIEHERVFLDDSVPQDPTVQARVDAWEAALAWEYCSTFDIDGNRYGRDNPAPDPVDLTCLQTELTTTRTTLLASEVHIRSAESNLGNWFADLARSELQADVAVINSGSLRLNQDIPPGPIRARQVAELFPYPSDMAVKTVTGAQLRQVLARSIEAWGSSGHWLQVSGVAFRFTPGGAVTDVHLSTDSGLVPLDDDASISLAMTTYMAGGGDGYSVLADIPEDRRSDRPLRTLVTEALRAAGPAGIGPVVEGRICNTEVPDAPCLVR